MKKLIFLLPLLVGSHGIMQASKQKTCTVAPTQIIDIEENLSNICDDISLWHKIFSNFIDTYSLQLEENKNQNNSSSANLFGDIWQLCSDKNKEIQPKRLIAAKNILYMYTEDQIEQLETLFKTLSANHWNKEIGIDRYTKNNLFSNNMFKTKSFRNFVLFAKNEKKIEKVNLLIKKMEEDLTTILSRQNNIITLNKDKHNKNDNDDNDNDYISDENSEKEDIFEFDDIIKEKNKEQLFQEKIVTIFIKIFNAEKHKNIQLLTSYNTATIPTIQPLNTIKPRNPGSIDNKTLREIKVPQTNNTTVTTTTTTNTNTMLSPRKLVSIDNVNHNMIKEPHANALVKNNNVSVELKTSNTPKLIDKKIKTKQKSKKHKKILTYIFLSNYFDVLGKLNNDAEKTAEISQFAGLDTLNNDSEKTAETAQNDTDTNSSSFSDIPDASIEYEIKEKKK